jgi:SAM-dependent methyltransferase
LKCEWFKDWFETEEFMTVYKHRDDADAAKVVNLILKNINIGQTKSVLDLACGAGRHSILFAQKGFEVVGVDLSSNLLESARLKSFELKLPISFINSDLRTFNTDRKFDLILNLFTSFGYFDSDEENEKIFSIASELLNMEGTFVFDFFNPEFIIENLTPHSIDKYENFTIEQFRYIEGGRIVKKIKIISSDGVKEFNESVKMYDLKWITESLQKKGFRIVNKFGNYDGEGFSSKNSARIFLICKK